jgi:DNA-directed RNA polymerase specialized sigma24 family protein
MEIMAADRTSRFALKADEIDLAVARFGSEMFGLALSITGNVADAEDAYQTSWMAALTHWGQVRDPQKRRSWLASIVARSALRARRRRLTWLGRHVPITAADGLSDVMRWDPAFGNALALLTDRQRAVLALHYGHGYSLDETAALLNCRGGTVRSHLSRALTTLRRSMSDDET